MDPALFQVRDKTRADLIIVHNEECGFLMNAKAQLGSRLFKTVLTCTDIRNAREKLNSHCERVALVITSDVSWAQELSRKHSSWLQVVTYQGDSVPRLMQALSHLLPRVG